MLDYPSPGGVNAVLRVLFKSKGLEKRLTAMKQRQLQKDRKKRLNGYLQGGGRLGKGKEISGYYPPGEDSTPSSAAVPLFAKTLGSVWRASFR